MLKLTGVSGGQPLLVNVTVAVPWFGNGGGAVTLYVADAPLIVPRVIGPLLTTAPATVSV
jgi:hypothetical protein